MDLFPLFLVVGMALFILILMNFLTVVCDRRIPRTTFRFLLSWWWPHRPVDAAMVIATAVEAIPENFAFTWDGLRGPDGLYVDAEPSTGLCRIKLPGMAKGEFAKVSIYGDYVLWRAWKVEYKRQKNKREKERKLAERGLKSDGTRKALELLTPLVEQKKKNLYKGRYF